MGKVKELLTNTLERLREKEPTDKNIIKEEDLAEQDYRNYTSIQIQILRRDQRNMRIGFTITTILTTIAIMFILYIIRRGTIWNGTNKK